MVDKSILLYPMQPLQGTEMEGDETDLKKAGWLYEEKWDGTNSLEGKVDWEVDITNKDGISYGKRGNLPEINKDLEDNCPNNTVFHSEICGFTEQGYSQLNLSSRRCGVKGRLSLTDYKVRNEPVVLMAHDILMLNGEDLRKHRLIERKEILRRFLSQHSFRFVRFTEYALHDGTEMFMHAHEGVMAKNINSQYVNARSASWMKIKHRITEICNVVGFYEGNGTRADTLGGLILTQNNKFCGTCGGFKKTIYGSNIDNALKRLGDTMRSLPQIPQPFRVPKHPDYVAVKTDLTVKVRALCWTPDHILREPVCHEVLCESVPRENIADAKPKKEVSLIFDGDLLL